ncbi:SDR family NAD(P)-dependent oxidoreductase [Streptomyces violaceochromogenes]|uniref:SDR family NAD(P)-dependent oxidoreductase n=1 Tax=Streptomyces violaceochromogenes TaxID=67377 RepID=A0ABU6LMP6_9ACTN|nr:SDR family NAD(P)-dependent oxidoreductase [Streptomyces violaceochromogenes]MEC7050785.1 SDR family NAD(P)-dependent oxidoreductase [Streptomyces violaceochromogenes]GHC84745.1 hypothetical protein GCM10010309_62640 [Streptomyces violaceochromogenes]
MAGLDLTGRTAVVTGASRGIGLAIAQAIAAVGANVVLTSRSQEAADAAAAQVGDTAIGVGAHAVDAMDEPRNKAMSGTPTAERIEALVAKAHEVADTADV